MSQKPPASVGVNFCWNILIVDFSILNYYVMQTYHKSPMKVNSDHILDAYHRIQPVISYFRKTTFSYKFHSIQKQYFLKPLRVSAIYFLHTENTEKRLKSRLGSTFYFMLLL